MIGPITVRPRRRRLHLLVAVFASAVLAVGASALLLESGSTPAAAANLAITQCNGINNTPGLTTRCSVSVINTLTDDPATSGSVVTLNGGSTPSSNIVTSVTQCNSSSRGGGGTLDCSVNIVNNIAMSGPSAATAASISQCNGNQPDGLGTAPYTCSPVANSGSGATIFQCNNRTGNGGGLVPEEPKYSHCSASGMVSSSLPITVNQCNEDAADGGGGKVSCTTSITTNVINTALVTGGGPTGGGGFGSPSGGTPPRITFGLPAPPTATPVPGIPKLTG